MLVLCKTPYYIETISYANQFVNVIVQRAFYNRNIACGKIVST